MTYDFIMLSYDDFTIEEKTYLFSRDKYFGQVYDSFLGYFISIFSGHLDDIFIFGMKNNCNNLSMNNSWHIFLEINAYLWGVTSVFENISCKIIGLMLS